MNFVRRNITALKIKFKDCARHTQLNAVLFSRVNLPPSPSWAKTWDQADLSRTWLALVPRTSQRMKKLPEDLNIFILDDSNVDRTNVASTFEGMEFEHDSPPVRTSCTPLPFNPPGRLSPSPAIKLNRIVPIGCSNDQMESKNCDAIQIVTGKNHITLGNRSEGPPHENCCRPTVGIIDSNNIESLISDEDCFPHNEITGTYVPPVHPSGWFSFYFPASESNQPCFAIYNYVREG